LVDILNFSIQAEAFFFGIDQISIRSAGAILATKLDDTDREILRIVQEDARKPYVRIASELKLSEGAVRFRMKRLLREGVITRFLALVDPRKIGLQVTAVVMLKVDATSLDDVFHRLVSLHESQHVFQSTGEYDIVAIVHARDLNHLGQLINRIKSFPNVRSASYSVITRLLRVEPTLKI
jgi:Lrp/AsnC family transcriptional regulator for asnA, asnC and gidA